MAFAEVVRPGDKVDIRLMQQVENAQNIEGPIKVYKSKILDIGDDGTYELSMPTEGSKLVLLSLDLRYEFVFYSGGLLYRSIGVIVERYRRDNIYINRVELKTHPERYQRREFYRLECTIDLDYYELTKEQAGLGGADEILAALRKEEPDIKPKRGTIVDISGGGIRFTSEQEVPTGSYLLAVFILYTDGVARRFRLTGYVVESWRNQGDSEKKYTGRVKFLIKDDTIREEIIQYIFKEERLTRQRARG